ncbi:MAG: glycosyltransferase family 4 protein [Sphingobacteriia bacterium]|nr:glycosyltransferase family 4 protein [Sphingobacteriia bacterium]
MKKHTTSSRMHVLYLPRWYPHRYDPMMGLFIQRHGQSVLPYADISVLYVHADDKLKDQLYEIVVSDNGIFEVHIYFKKSLIKPGFIANTINGFRFFKSHLKGMKEILKHRTKPDLLHVHVLTRCGLVAAFYKLFNSVPYVITEHWTRYLPTTDSYRGRLRKWLTSLVVKHAGAVMPVTANLRDAMIEKGLKNDNYVVIPNVVDTEKFKPQTKNNTSGKKILVHLSCFTDKQKNISGILRVIKNLSGRRDDFLLKLIGEGEDFREMKTLSDSLGLTGRFTEFTGLKENEALAELLANADLMIMFSNYENLPVVILESYSCGVPVISTKVGGIHEHMNNDLGRLVTMKDEDQFLEALDTFLDNPKVYQKEKIRDYAVAHFSKEVIGREIFQVYTSVSKQFSDTDN